MFAFGAAHSELAEHYLQGVNIMAFCKEYNAATQAKVGTVIPVEITVFEVSQYCTAALPTDWCIHVHHSDRWSMLGRLIYSFVLFCGCSSMCSAGNRQCISIHKSRYPTHMASTAQQT